MSLLALFVFVLSQHRIPFAIATENIVTLLLGLYSYHILTGDCILTIYISSLIKAYNFNTARLIDLR